MADARTLLSKFGPSARCADVVNSVPAEIRPKGGATITFLNINVWRHRNRIPADWYPAILFAAALNGVEISEQDLIFHLVEGRPAESTPVDQAAA